jgi:hypothetical protein
MTDERSSAPRAFEPDPVSPRPGEPIPRAESPSPPAIALPGTIQAEDFKEGGEGVGYHDTTPGNNGMETSRDPTDVDINTPKQCGGRPTPCVGWFVTGEWLAYDIEVATTGSYTFTLAVASMVDTGAFHLEVDGVAVTGSIDVASTGSYDVWADLVVPGVELTAGSHELRFYSDSDVFDTDYMVVVLEAPACGNGEVDAGEECDGEACCTEECELARPGTVCRPSTGAGDVAETCARSEATCPPDDSAADAGVDAGIEDDAGTPADTDAGVGVDAGETPAADAGEGAGLAPHGSGLLCDAGTARSRGGSGAPGWPALAVGLAALGLALRRRR